MAPKTVDLVFADPPFNIGYEYDQYDDRRDSGDYLDWCKVWIGQCYDVLKTGGSFWLAIGDDYVAELSIIARKFGFTRRDWVIWHYTFGTYRAANFAKCHTHLLYFTKGPKPAYFQPGRVKSVRQEIGDKRANPQGKIPGNVWTISRVCGTFKERTKHPCQMPEAVLERSSRQVHRRAVRYWTRSRGVERLWPWLNAWAARGPGAS